MRGFLASPEAAGIEYIARADVQAVLERFLDVCRTLERTPAELRAPDLTALLEEHLPARYTPREPLGQRTIDVLRVFLAFLERDLGPARTRELCLALEQSAETFRALVRGERPLRRGG